MGRALTTEDCLKQAQEYLSQAERMSDPVTREEILELAKELTEKAGRLDDQKAKRGGQ